MILIILSKIYWKIKFLKFQCYITQKMLNWDNNYFYLQTF